MRKIKLTQGKYAMVDDEDFEWLNQWKWHFNSEKLTGYAVRWHGGRKTKKQIFMHRIIIGCKDGFFVDHINHNGIDNRKKNLRICTGSQNQMNKRKCSHRIMTSKYKGVHKYRNKWCSKVSKNKEIVWTGYFETEHEAFIAYKKMAIKYHGEFACFKNLTLAAYEAERKSDAK